MNCFQGERHPGHRVIEALDETWRKLMQLQVTLFIQIITSEATSEELLVTCSM